MFVIISKNTKSVPSDEDIRAAMAKVDGQVVAISTSRSGTRVDFTGLVNHNRFAQALADRVAGSNANSWDFAWADTASSEQAAHSSVS